MRPIFCCRSFVEYISSSGVWITKTLSSKLTTLMSSRTFRLVLRVHAWRTNRTCSFCMRYKLTSGRVLHLLLYHPWLRNLKRTHVMEKWPVDWLPIFLPWYKAMLRNRSVFSTWPMIRINLLVTTLTTSTCIRNRATVISYVWFQASRDTW